MSNQQWVWQRLFKHVGSPVVCATYATDENDPDLYTTDSEMNGYGLVWLCPKPNRVLVDKAVEDLRRSFWIDRELV